MRDKKKRASITDVAKRAKVSITTVSRVINSVTTVSSRNRAKVEEAIAYYKFKPNVNAQRLATGVNNAIGLVIPGYPGIFYSFYAIELIRGVGHACETLRLDLVFHISNANNPINTHNVGGVIFADIIENHTHVEHLVHMGIPCVIINNKVKDLDVGYIAIDNYSGGKQAAEYLFGLGHKKIATITGTLTTQAALERFNGFKEYLDQQGVLLPDEYIYKGDYSRRCARLAAEEFFGRQDPPTAVFAASDEMALELIAYLLEQGYKVPDDVSVIGFDDNPACLYGPVGLTTIRQPLFEMADESVRALHAILQGKSKKQKHKVLIPDLVIRESCAPHTKA
ncbi:MAG: LacI family transcriptional regulator [Candidatus Omnitrophica bacterium]|nr:LacI family transcriptional regulator [Candidatus Omnitrophota bacterium]